MEVQDNATCGHYSIIMHTLVLILTSTSSALSLTGSLIMSPEVVYISMSVCECIWSENMYVH